MDMVTGEPALDHPSLEDWRGEGFAEQVVSIAFVNEME